MIIVLIVGLIKKPCIKMRQYFPKPYRNVKVNLSYYTTKTN